MALTCPAFGGALTQGLKLFESGLIWKSLPDANWLMATEFDAMTPALYDDMVLRELGRCLQDRGELDAMRVRLAEAEVPRSRALHD